MARSEDLRKDAERAKEEGEKLHIDAEAVRKESEHQSSRIQQDAFNKEREAETLERAANDAEQQEHRDQELHDNL